MTLASKIKGGVLFSQNSIYHRPKTGCTLKKINRQVEIACNVFTSN